MKGRFEGWGQTECMVGKGCGFREDYGNPLFVLYVRPMVASLSFKYIYIFMCFN